MKSALDTQQIEILGKTILISELVKNGFEVAEPIRDKGYDLIVYSEPNFNAIPIQLKTSTGSAFGIWKKYEKFENLVYAFVWHILDEPKVFLLDYNEALQFVPNLEGHSWQNNKCYTWSTAPNNIEQKLKAFENRWGFLRGKINKNALL